jgi:hypothetical protein
VAKFDRNPGQRLGSIERRGVAYSQHLTAIQRPHYQALQRVVDLRGPKWQVQLRTVHDAGAGEGPDAVFVEDEVGDRDG